MSNGRTYRRCAGCGCEKDDRNKYCPSCRAKLAEMKAAGYLQSVPSPWAPTVFSDERGRKLRRPVPLPVEDRYDEESNP